METVASWPGLAFPKPHHLLVPSRKRHGGPKVPGPFHNPQNDLLHLEYQVVLGQLGVIAALDHVVTIARGDMAANRCA